MTQADRDNQVRYRPGVSAGHVESFFLKANAPGSGRAFWLKFTIYAPSGAAATDAVAEVWAIVFDRTRGAHVAGKETYPIARATFGSERPRFAVDGAILEPGATRGRVKAGDHTVEWDLRFTEGAPPLHLFPSDALYETAVFPRSKVLSPYPDSRFSGRLSVDGTAWEVDGWPGMQGHNWGKGHAFRYAWGHVNAFRDAPGTYFEGASAKIKLGPITTPFMTLLYLHHGGRAYDFRGIQHWFTRSVSLDGYAWTFDVANAEARLKGRLEARPEDLVGLIYTDPDGAKATCLNSKIARCRLEIFERAGKGFEPVATLEAEDSAALEILVREADHGIKVYA